MRTSVGRRVSVRGALRWVPAFLQAGLLFWLSAQPDLRFAEEPALDFVVRKTGHLSAYALLAVLVAWALGGVTRDARRAGLVVALVLAYAISDEIHQASVPGRAATIGDVAIDTAGAILGTLLFRYVAGLLPWDAVRR